MIKENLQKKKVKINDKIFKVFILFVIVFVIVFFRFFYISVLRGSLLREMGLNQWMESGKVLQAKRGTIFDRNGKILAISIERHKLILNKNQVKDVDVWIDKYSELLNIDKEILREAFSKNKSQVILKDDINREEKKKIEKFLDSTLYFELYYKRVYPYGNLASYLLGIMGVDRGLEGLEYQFDDILKGKDGMIGFMVDALRNEIPGTEFVIKKPENGKDLYLTIDINLQGMLEEELENCYKEYYPRRVIGIIEDVKTGEIISIANIPNFNPNDFDDFSKFSYPDPSYGYNYEPGSSFKPLIASAVLEEKAISEDDEFECRGYIVRDNKTFKCTASHGKQTLKDLLRNSCNVGFIQVGERLNKRLYYYLKLFGVGEKIGLDFPYEGSGDILEPDDWSATTLTTMSFGVGVTVTPLQQTTFYQTIANKGNRLKPQIVKKIVDGDNIIEESKPVLVKKVISEETADTILSYLDYVVSDKGVKSATISGYSIGGKTGTAGVIKDGKYVEGESVLWFIGILSCNNPQYIITIVVDGVRSYDVFASGIAAPVFRKVTEKIINYYGIKEDEEVK
ncbi:MAG TPA: penicillin-binding protein 2 [Caldisericia bacterium]|mgnify:FL=1|nr:penicillin-binding protein 2 [Caldisericia bacterium]HPC56915.1 penicillin-binding protein 2 [Caldisericia bacterium]HPP43545.1 penicillin-binding protein 2 [Caldisericia bacterium]HRT37336.1 penicillin-binding protein 2 [Caldisericia bacterium]